MAKCEKREIKPDPPPVEFVLTMNATEALAVCRALDRFSENESHEVWRALYSALG